MITIDELMTADPYTLRETDSLEDARQMMTDKNVRHIPITDDQKQLLGLVTQRDILAATNPKSHKQGLPAETDQKIADIMIKNVSVLLKTDSVRQAALHLQKHKYGCLPVIENERLVGIITDSDFITVAINLLEQVEIAEDEVEYEPDIMEDVEMPVMDEEF